MLCCTDKAALFRAVARLGLALVMLQYTQHLAAVTPANSSGAPPPPPAGQAPALTEEQCRGIAIRLGDPAERAAALEELNKAPYFPSSIWVTLLSDHDLATRLGALEVLEDRAGTDFDYDPWESDPVRRRENTARWSEWAQKGGGTAPGGEVGASLSHAAMQGYLRDILSGDTEETERALGKLQPFSRQAIGSIEAYLSRQTATTPGLRGRLKEAQFRLLLDGTGVSDGRRAARLLAAGNRDEKVEALDLLVGAPVSVTPLIGEALQDTDPLVRERAMDLLLSIGGAAAIPPATAHLETDTDSNVTHAAIRALGMIEGAGSVRALVPYLKGDDEDQVSAALQSLRLLGDDARSARSDVEPCLSHPSWRVRSAALHYIIKTRVTGMDALVLGLLDDEDSFVRTTAVQAVAISGGGSRSSSRNNVEEKKFPPEIEAAIVAAAKKYPDLQGPIFRACRDAGRPIPAELLKSFDQAPQEVKLAALQAFSPANEREGRLLEKAAVDPDPDLAAAALTTLARSESPNERVRRLLVDALIGSDSGKRKVVLDHLEWETGKVTSRSAWTEAVALSKGASPAAPSREAVNRDDPADDLLTAFGLGEPGKETAAPDSTASLDSTSPTATDALFDAFGLGEGTNVTPPAPVEADPLDALSAAFLGEDSPAPPPGAESGTGEMINTIEEALQRLAAVPELAGNDEDSRAGMQAARLLVQGGSARAITYLVAALPKLNVQDRADLAADLDSQPHPGFIPLWKGLLHDNSREVRQRALRAALDDDYPVLVEYALGEALGAANPNEIADFYSSSFEYLSENRDTKKTMAAMAHRLLAEGSDTSSQVMGLIILRSAQASADLRIIEEKTQSPDYWVRRAAVMALGAGSAKNLAARFGALASDESAWVREAAATAPGRELKVWTHRFSDTTEVKDEKRERSYDFGGRGNSSLFSSGGGANTLAPEVAAGLRGLTADLSERVRLAAWMSLLANRQQIDIAAVSDLLSRSPDREIWADRLADHMGERSAELGPALRPLLAYVDRSAIDTEKLVALEKRLGVTAREQPRLDFSAFVKTAATENVKGSAEESSDNVQFVESTPSPTDGSADTGDDAPVRILFFYNPGCHECDRVREDIEALKRRFPGVLVTEYNIRETPAVLLNEALSSRFSVDPALRQVTPSVFLQEGALVKSEITRPALTDLVRRTLRVGETDSWYNTADSDLEAARDTVENRFAAFGLIGVFLAGLLDGINPCAFATIIFLLSYLQVTRRSSTEILAVGGAFILGVFLTYFALGLGLVEVVGKLNSFRIAGRILNLFLAGACLWVAWMSFRDARLARKGELSGMTLQLPGFLKERIRTVIRTGARSRRFVVAAFLSAIVISVLELACTGQVYLPTIVYAMKSGAGKAVWFLLLYNVAFILPLVVVFILAWRGLKSDALIRYQVKHTATVKTAMGWLFVLLFFALLWSGRL